MAKVVLRAQGHVDKVVVIDDGSTDDTAMIAEALGALVIRHGRRRGYGEAIRSCFETALSLGADVLVTLDADGQHDPDQIPSLVNPIKDGQADIAVGSRFLKAESEMPRYRKAGIRLLTRFTGASCGGQFSDSQCGFRAYAHKAIEQMVPSEQGMGVSVEILMKAKEKNLRIVEVPVNVRYSGLIVSSQNPLPHGVDIIASIIKLTSMRHPLLFYGTLGATALAVSSIFGLWALEIYAREGRIVTNIALISVGSGVVGLLALFTGTILFTLINVVREIKVAHG